MRHEGLKRGMTPRTRVLLVIIGIFLVTSAVMRLVIRTWLTEQGWLYGFVLPLGLGLTSLVVVVASRRGNNRPGPRAP